MAKVSRPVIYTAVGAVVVFAIVYLTGPQPVAPHKAAAKKKATTADASGFLPEDYSAKFPRYGGGARNPFTPAVVVATAAPPPVHAKPPSLPTGIGGIPAAPPQGWALTGINQLNGVTTALLENSGSGDSVFLKVGDRWSGLHVTEIRQDGVIFQNALGQRALLSFPSPADDTASGPTIAPGGTMPSVSSVTPLPPMPVTNVPSFPAPAAPSGGADTPQPSDNTDN